MLHHENARKLRAFYFAHTSTGEAFQPFVG